MTTATQESDPAPKARKGKAPPPMTFAGVHFERTDAGELRMRPTAELVGHDLLDVGDETRYRHGARHEKRVRVRVDNAKCNLLALPSGFAVPRGVHEVFCYLSEVPQIEALLEPDLEAYLDCHREAERRIARDVATTELVGGHPLLGAIANLPTDEKIAIVLGRKGDRRISTEAAAELNKIHDKHRAQTPHSAESVFMERFDRAPLPLQEVTILEEFEPPEVLAEIQRVKTAEASTGPLIAAMQEQTKALIEMQRESNEQVRALIAALVKKEGSK
jgi:hypothetical protein